jgi:hypothetical protein
MSWQARRTGWIFFYLIKPNMRRAVLTLVLLWGTGVALGGLCTSNPAEIAALCPSPNVYDPDARECTCAIGYTTGSFGACTVDNALMAELSTAISTLCNDCTLDTTQDIIDAIGGVYSFEGCETLIQSSDRDHDCYEVVSADEDSCTFKSIGAPTVQLETTHIEPHAPNYRNEVVYKVTHASKKSNKIAFIWRQGTLDIQWSVVNPGETKNVASDFGILYNMLKWIRPTGAFYDRPSATDPYDETVDDGKEAFKPEYGFFDCPANDTITLSK